MCGIVLVYGKPLSYTRKALELLLYMDVKRGRDSTGVVHVSSDCKAGYTKSLGTPEQLFDTKEYQEMMKEDAVCLIGHNRAATIGHVSTANAHPFNSGKIWGVHNGTLRTRMSGKHALGTDSEGLFEYINEKGIAQTWKEMNGAATLAYWDEEDNSLNLIRNKERPFFFSVCKKGVLWGASEPWMLTAIADVFDMECTEPEQINENVLNKLVWTGGKPNITQTCLTPWKAPVIQYHNKYPASIDKTREKQLPSLLKGNTKSAEYNVCCICCTPDDVSEKHASIWFGDVKACPTCSDFLEQDGFFKDEFVSNVGEKRCG